MANLCSSSLSLNPSLFSDSSSFRARLEISRFPSCGRVFYGGLSRSANFARGVTLRVAAQAQQTSALPEATRRLYVGNIPRNVDNEELTRLFQEHGSVENAEVMYDKYSGRSRRFAFITMTSEEDANAAIENMNGKEIGGRQIKVNITEKPLQPVDPSNIQAEESGFIDSQYKVYVGNLAKTVTSDMLRDFFSEKGKVLSAKISRLPGTSKSSGFGFISFSSEEEVEAAISSFHNTRFDGQQIRVNRA